MQLQRLGLIQDVICVCCVLHNICIDMGDTGNYLEILPNEAAAAVREAAPQPPLQPRPCRATTRDAIDATFAQRLLQGGE